jgi:AraC-like DNA-binding protein
VTLASLSTPPTAAAFYLRYLLDALSSLGLQIPAEVPLDPQARVSLALIDQVLVQAQSRWVGPPLGLQLGAAVTPVAIDVLAYASMSSNTLGDSIELLCQFETYRLGFARCRVERQADAVLVVMDTQGDWASLSVQIEASLAGWIAFGQWITGKPGHHPRCVTFRHACAGDPLAYERYFGCPVLFDQARHAVQLDPAQLDWPLAAPNPQVSQLMRDEMTRRVDQFARGDQFLAALEGLLEAMLPLGEPAQEDVAARLGLSARQLRQRCSDAGVSFASALDGVRQRQARRYLGTALPLLAISQKLGYSEQSAFSRACVRWFGVSPGRWPGRE